MSTMPTHPRTGLEAIGFLRNGEPVWPVMGAAEATGGGGDEDAAFLALGGKPEGADASDPADATAGDDAENELGDKGKQALDRMKAKLKDERARRAAAERAAAEKADSDEADKIRREAEQAAIAKANARIVRSEVKAAAAGKLHDPSDAFLHLDLESFEVDEDGNIDEDEIADAIADLLARKPYLAAQGGTKAPKPDRSQGARGQGAASTAQQFADAIPL